MNVADLPVDQKKVNECNMRIADLKDRLLTYLSSYRACNRKEAGLVGTLALSITNPSGLIEFDAFLGDAFIIEASLNRLMAKMRQPPSIPAPPSIVPATSVKN